MKGFFVTGTDTSVGKTFVTVALADTARRQGQRVFAFKPIETGCREVDGQRVGADQEAISSAWQAGELRGVYRFLAPRSPLAAAAAEGVAIDIDRIVEVAKRGASEADLVLVEGAGGWRVPITPDHDIGRLAHRLGWPVIVVARPGLGTINHTLLTVEAIHRDGCAIARIVLSRSPTEDPAFAQQNAAMISDRCGLAVAAGLEDLTLA